MENTEQTTNPTAIPPVRKVLLALAWLHAQGYQQLRISAGASPTGSHWRYQILPRRYFDPNNGLLLTKGIILPPHPKDAVGGKMDELPEPEVLGQMWLDHYECLEEGLAADEHYAKWYANFLELLELTEAPVMYAPWEMDLQKGFRIKAKFLSLPKFYNLLAPPKDPQRNNPLHGVTLEQILHYLVKTYGWQQMAAQVPIRCFELDPSIKSSLTFLRKTPWARARVERMYLDSVG